jgi:hypothetical protein
MSETPNKNKLQLELNVENNSFIIHMLHHGCQHKREEQGSPPQRLFNIIDNNNKRQYTKWS